MARRAPRDPRVVLILSVIFFTMLAMFMMATAQKGDPVGWGLAAVSGGFACIGTAPLIAFGPADERGRRRPSMLGWVLMLVGAAVMSIGPILIHDAGIGWGERLSSGRRSGPLVFFALLIWFGSAAIAAGAVHAAVRRLRAQRYRSRRD